MEKFIVTGGKKLHGAVRLGGAKNASFKVMIAALLGKGESRLLNFSHISDVQVTSELIRALGGRTRRSGERTMFIDPSNLNKYKIPKKFGSKSRATPMFVPILLHRFGKAAVPIPGGDKIGKRPLGRHWKALESMGAKIIKKNGYIKASTKGLKGTRYRFEKNSHTGTETVIMAAVKASGKTIIENASLEPEVDDLIEYLNDLGGRVRRRHNRVIEIQGVKRLKSAIHRMMPDRNEAVTYACAAIATKGDIIVENANQNHLEAFLEKLEEIGGGFEVGKYGIRFYYKKPLRATDVVTQPHPGFMTDWQPLWTILVTQAKGTSVVHEAVFPSRFQYINALVDMGVKVSFFNPEVDFPEKLYNFNVSEETSSAYHAIRIHGPTKLKAKHIAVSDIRAGATTVLAALIAEGQSTITGVHHIDRGYENLDGRLIDLGAKIKRM